MIVKLDEVDKENFLHRQLERILELGCNRTDTDTGCAWWEDEEGNIYRDKQEYLTETRDKKINEILK